GWPGDPGSYRVAEPRAEAPVRPGIQPAAWLARLDVLARVADEVAAIADHDRVGLKQRRELAVNPHRVDREGAAGKQLGIGRSSGPARPREARQPVLCPAPRQAGLLRLGCKRGEEGGQIARRR